MRTIMAVLVLGVLSGCASINNSVALDPATPPQGLAYSLPTRPVAIDLVYDPARGFALSVTLLPAVADRDTIQLLGYTGSPFDKDTVQWTTVNGLLTDVNVATTSKLLDTAQGAGESIGSIAAILETDASSNQIMVAQLNFDPADPAATSKVAGRLTDALRDFARRELTRDAMAAPLKKTDIAGLANKKVRDAVLTEALTATIQVETDLAPAAAVPGGNADCTVGVCYRPLRYGQLTISVGPVVFAQLGMSVPNGARAIAFPIKRSGAADGSTVLTLDHGVLTGATITKEAEAPNIVRIPGTLIGGVIKGLTDTITARKGIASAQSDYVKALTDKVNADAALVAAQKAATTAATSTTGLQVSVDNNPYLGWLPAGLSSAPAVGVSASASVTDATLQPDNKAQTPATGGANGGKPGDAGNPGKPTGGPQSPPGTGAQKPPTTGGSTGTAGN